MTRATAFALSVIFAAAALPASAATNIEAAPTAQGAIGKTVVMDRHLVLVEPANLGAGRSRSIVVAGTEQDRYRLENYNPAAARKRWKQGYSGQNFYIERGEFERMQKVAHRWEMAFLGMAAVDTAQTVASVGRGKAVELNPILGRHPSVGKIIGYKVLMSGAHYALFRYANARNPNTARKGAMGSFAIQSGFVAFNLNTMF